VQYSYCKLVERRQIFFVDDEQSGQLDTVTLRALHCQFSMRALHGPKANMIPGLGSKERVSLCAASLSPWHCDCNSNIYDTLTLRRLVVQSPKPLLTACLQTLLRSQKFFALQGPTLRATLDVLLATAAPTYSIGQLRHVDSGDEPSEAVRGAGSHNFRLGGLHSLTWL
jgi:hypothetical protein